MTIVINALRRSGDRILRLFNTCVANSAAIGAIILALVSCAGKDDVAVATVTLPNINSAVDRCIDARTSLNIGYAQFLSDVGKHNAYKATRIAKINQLSMTLSFGDRMQFVDTMLSAENLVNGAAEDDEKRAEALGVQSKATEHTCAFPDTLRLLVEASKAADSAGKLAATLRICSDAVGGLATDMSILNVDHYTASQADAQARQPARDKALAGCSAELHILANRFSVSLPASTSASPATTKAVRVNATEVPPPILPPSEDSVTPKYMAFGDHDGEGLRVLSVDGVNTPSAHVRVTYDIDEARSSCERGGDDSSECPSNAQKANRMTDGYANCRTGEITAFWGSKYRYEGPNSHTSADALDLTTAFLIRDGDGELLGGSAASKYDAVLGMFSALCHRDAKPNAAEK